MEIFEVYIPKYSRCESWLFIPSLKHNNRQAYNFIYYPLYTNFYSIFSSKLHDLSYNLYKTANSKK